MKNKIPYLLLFVFIVFLPQAYASGPLRRTVDKEDNPPVIAVIYKTDLKEHQLIRLLEARLSGAWKLVEREQIDRILDEQRLSLILGEAADGRVQAGQLLGADLLVVISVDKSGGVDAAFCETKHGYRIRHVRLEAPEISEQVIDLLESEFLLAVQKSTEEITTIFAVPPFINHDLGAAFDHYQKGYARLIESMLFPLPGVIVVELSEAREIAREIQLQGSEIKRPLPFYIMGEYRYETNNPQNPPYVKIALKQNEQIIDERIMEKAAAEGTPDLLRSAVQEFLQKVMGQDLTVPQKEVEVKLLTQRANRLYEIGHYQEAVEVMEASLLLDNEQTDLHQLAMVAYGRLARRRYETEGSWVFTYDKKHIYDCLYRVDRSLEHLEQLLRKKKIAENDAHTANAISETFYFLIDISNDDPLIMHQVRKRLHDLRDVYYRVMKARKDDGTLDDGFLNLVLYRSLTEPAIFNETLKANLDKRLELVPVLQEANLNYKSRWLGELVDAGLNDYMKNSFDFLGFLYQLEKFQIPELTEIVHKERLQLKDPTKYPFDPEVSYAMNEVKFKNQEAELEKEYNNPFVPTQPQEKADAKLYLSVMEPETFGSSVKFVPLRFYSDEQHSYRENFKLMGILPCNGQTDLLWGFRRPREVYLMKEKGVLKRIFAMDNQHDFRDAVFDGEWAWLPIVGAQTKMLVINPQTEQVLEFTSDHGIPENLRFTAMAPMGPRKICFAGSVTTQGRTRAFIAVLTLISPSRLDIRLVHEANRQLRTDQIASQEDLDPDLAFRPVFMVSQPRPESDGWDIAVARSLPGSQGKNTAMLVKPDIPQVRIMKAAVENIIARDVCYKDHAAYWVTGLDRNQGGIKRLGVDSTADQIVASAPETDGTIIYYKDQFHVVGKNWWVTDGRFHKPWKKLSAQVPGQKVFLHKLYNSHHYGLIFETSDGDWQLFQVRLTDR